jgi:hypothetical protein
VFSASINEFQTYNQNEGDDPSANADKSEGKNATQRRKEKQIKAQ